MKDGAWGGWDAGMRCWQRCQRIRHQRRKECRPVQCTRTFSRAKCCARRSPKYVLYHTGTESAVQLEPVAGCLRFGKLRPWTRVHVSADGTCPSKLGTCIRVIRRSMRSGPRSHAIAKQKLDKKFQTRATQTIHDPAPRVASKPSSPPHA